MAGHPCGRAEDMQYLFYATGFAAILSLVRWKKSSLRQFLPVLTLLLAFTCVAVAGWISRAGGQIRHSEFRDSVIPQQVSLTKK